MYEDTFAKKALAFALTALTTVLVVAPLLFGIAAYEGFIVAKLWSWFVTPLGLPAIGTMHAAGLVLIVALASYQFIPEGENDTWKRLFYMVAAPAFALVLGAFFHAFM